MNIVRHLLNQTVRDVGVAQSGASPLPMSSAAMLPGNYVFNGTAYDCMAPGLYYFWSGFGAPIYARLVYGDDLYAFLSGVSWHHIHGIQDEGLASNMQALANAGMGHKWRLRCGFISALMAWWLPSYGLQVRQVSALTLEPSNGVDDGHVMIEVMHEGKWKMWDITNGCYFTSANGEHLNLGEVVSAGVGNCIIVQIDGDEKRGSDVVILPGNQPWCMASYRDVLPDIDSWFARVFQSWSVIA